MTEDINSVNMLARREIEALVAGPMIKAFSKEFGTKRTETVVKKIIKELAMESGRMLAAFTGGNKLSDLEKGLPLFAQGGALEFELVEADSEKIRMNITRCRYAEMYQKNGMPEFGYLLSCGRDYALIEGFNPDIILDRTQTIMEGAAYCDFCFSMKK